MPPDQSDPGASFLRLKESLGSLLLCWSRLEDAIYEAARRVMGPSAASPASFAQRLVMLKLHLAGTSDSAARSRAEIGDLVARIDAVRRSRNLIAHRLSGICADPVRGEPHILCDSGAGVRRRSVMITQEELTELLAEIDSCTRDLAQIN